MASGGVGFFVNQNTRNYRHRIAKKKPTPPEASFSRPIPVPISEQNSSKSVDRDASIWAPSGLEGAAQVGQIKVIERQ